MSIKPFLPELLEQINVKKLRVNNSTIDLKIERHANDVGINILKKKGPATVFIEK